MCHQEARYPRISYKCWVLLFVGLTSCTSCILASANPQGSPSITDARFTVDSEADPLSAPPGQLHPRLSLCSVVATIEPDKFDAKYSTVELTFFSFPLAPEDVAAARKGDIAPLFQKSDALQNKNHKPGVGWAIVQLTVDEHFKIRDVRMTIPGYTILLQAGELQDVKQDYHFDGKRVTVKNKGSYRVGHMPAGVAPFTLGWDFNVSSLPVVNKRIAAK